jgi:hypothetical protein
MRLLHLLAIAAAAAVLLSACASPEPPERPYVTTYYDRNHDGIVDFEMHDIPGAADAAWALSDADFDGRYDVRLKFGFAFERARVDVPVPQHVQITTDKLPVFTTR